MIKKLLLVAVFLVAGLVFGLHMQGVSITGLFNNAVAIVYGFAQTIETSVLNLVQSIQRNAVPTLSGIAIGATPVILLAGKAYSVVKNRLSAKVREATEQKNLAQIQTKTITEEYEGKIEALQNEATNYQEKVTSQIGELKAQLTKKDDIIERQRKDLERIKAEANAISRIKTEDVANLVYPKEKDATRVP